MGGQLKQMDHLHKLNKMNFLSRTKYIHQKGFDPEDPRINSWWKNHVICIAEWMIGIHWSAVYQSSHETPMYHGSSSCGLLWAGTGGWRQQGCEFEVSREHNIFVWSSNIPKRSIRWVYYIQEENGLCCSMWELQKPHQSMIDKLPPFVCILPMPEN